MNFDRMYKRGSIVGNMDDYLSDLLKFIDPEK
jgi:hypothetical protein